MMSTIDALDAWWPPTLTPVSLGRPRLAASTIAADSHSTRRAISRSTPSSYDVVVAVVEPAEEGAVSCSGGSPG